MSAFADGYQAFANSAGVNMSAFGGDSYVGTVESAIDELTSNLNQFKGDNTDIQQLKGAIAEFWQAGTFNVDAAIKGDSSRIIVPRSNGLGSADLESTWGDEIGLKYYCSGEESARQQAKSLWLRYKEYSSRSKQPLSYEDYVKDLLNIDKNSPLYSGQIRLIPTDQLEEAKKWLQRQIMTETARRPEEVARYEETLKLITDRIRNSNGTESIPLTEAESKEIARQAKEAGFDPIKNGLTPEELIKWQNIMKKAYAAGLSAAVISIVLEVAPKFVDILSKLIRDGEVNAEDFKRVGFAALKGSSLGFIRGSVASAITIACEAGKFGTDLKNANPTTVGAIVALTMNTLQNATMMAFGKITKQEFANECIQNLFTTSCSLALGSAFSHVLGSALQVLVPELPILAFMLGSFIGSVVGSFIYKTTHSCMISFCIDTGCTFFGLVEQDYTLPENVLKELGIQVFEYEKFYPKQLKVKKFEPKKFEPKQFEPQTIGITVLRRGVIGVNNIGFV
jgi:hypothetical protein